MELNLEDLAKITDFTLSHYNEHAEDFWEGSGVGEYAIEMAIRQIEFKKILLPYFAATMGAGHHGEMRGAIQPYVTEFSKYLEVAAGPAAKVWYRIGRLTLDALQQRSDVLRVLLELYASLKPGGVLFSSNPRGHNEEGWNGGRYGVYHDLDTWRSYVSLDSLRLITITAPPAYRAKDSPG